MVNSTEKYFILNGVKSSDFGVWCSGDGVFDSSPKRYEKINVPGRNGALFIEDGSYENVEMVFKDCFIPEDFPKNYAAFRRFLYQLKGYQRLELSWLPDEYRLAMFTGDIEPDVKAWNGTGTFDLTFDCKPQRFLKSGEKPIYLIPTVPTGNEFATPIYELNITDGSTTRVEFAYIRGSQDLSLEIREYWNNDYSTYSTTSISLFPGKSRYYEWFMPPSAWAVAVTGLTSAQWDEINVQISGTLYRNGKHEHFTGIFGRNIYINNPTGFDARPTVEVDGNVLPLHYITLSSGERWRFAARDYSALTSGCVFDCENEYLYYTDSNGKKKNLTDYLTITHEDADYNALPPSFPRLGEGNTQFQVYTTSAAHNFLMRLTPHWYTI